MKWDTREFDSLLAELSAGSLGYFGDGAARIEPVARIDRQYSALLRLRITTAAREFHAFLKIFKPRGQGSDERAQLQRFVEREYRSTLRLYEGLRERPELRALRPLAVFPAQLALVTEEAIGDTFDLVVRRGLKDARAAGAATAAAERIGKWIATYQVVTDTEGQLSLDERRDYLDVRLRKLAGDILSEAERQHILSRFDRIARGIAASDLALVAIHADLSPTNILVAPDGGVTILDFAMAKTGARHHDVAHLYLHLERLRRRFPWRRHRVEQMLQALLRGASPSLTEHDPIFALMLLQHIVCDIAQQAERNVGFLRPAYRVLLRRRLARSPQP